MRPKAEGPRAKKRTKRRPENDGPRKGRSVDRGFVLLLGLSP
jgi:hypothetical protein